MHPQWHPPYLSIHFSAYALTISLIPMYKGHYYIVIIDRYSNWPIVMKGHGGAQALINILRRTFVTYDIREKLASDGGREFTSSTPRSFLRNWGVHHRLSSFAFPHSNIQTEIGVMTMKRLISSNTVPHGDLDTDAFQWVILQYCNTLDPATKLSPATCVFGQPIKDFILIMPGRYQPHATWHDTLAAWEEALRNHHMRAAEYWSKNTRCLPPLCVCIQNQTSRQPLKWDKTGIIIELHQHNQYAVKVDCSGRVTLRNRKFLRRYTPYAALRSPVLISDDLKAPSTQMQIPHDTLPVPLWHSDDEPLDNTAPAPAHDQAPVLHEPPPVNPALAAIPAPPVSPSPRCTQCSAGLPWACCTNQHRWTYPWRTSMREATPAAWVWVGCHAPQNRQTVIVSICSCNCHLPSCIDSYLAHSVFEDHKDGEIDKNRM